MDKTKERIVPTGKMSNHGVSGEGQRINEVHRPNALPTSVRAKSKATTGTKPAKEMLAHSVGDSHCAHDTQHTHASPEIRGDLLVHETHQPNVAAGAGHNADVVRDKHASPTNCDGQLTDANQRRNAIAGGGQAMHKIQKPDAASEPNPEANDTMSTMQDKPRAARAITVKQTKADMRGRTKSGDQCANETHQADVASKGKAIEIVTPMGRMPSPQISEPSDEMESIVCMAQTGSAISPMKSKNGMRGRTKIDGRDIHKSHEAHAIDGEGHGGVGTQDPQALSTISAERQHPDVTHLTDAIGGEGEGQPTHVDQALYALPYQIITALWRQRYAWVRSRTSMNLAGQARCRAFANGDKGEAAKLWAAFNKGEEIDAMLAITLRPYARAIAMFDEEIKPVEKQLSKLIKGLACYPWLAAQKGIGPMYIAGLFGECGGPITKSHSVSSLWKFFGLAVFDGKRQAFSTDAAENKRMSYSSRRRSLISQIESSFVMQKSPWREVYEARKIYELERGIAKGHAHNRAKRYMGKRFLRELFRHAQEVEIGHRIHETHGVNADLDTNSGGHSKDDTHYADAASKTGHMENATHGVNARSQNLSDHCGHETQIDHVAQDVGHVVDVSHREHADVSNSSGQSKYAYHHEYVAGAGAGPRRNVTRIPDASPGTIRPKRRGT